MTRNRLYAFFALLTWLSACDANQSSASSGAAGASWPALAGSPGSGLKTVALPPQRNQTAPGAVLSDIVSHLPDTDGNTYYDSDLVTWGHETSHGLSAYLRNTLNNTGRPANGFYLTANKAAIVVEPKILKQQVAAFVPAALRGSRFALYVTGQLAWDASPLYIFDEFNAYINGAKVGVDLYQKHLWTYGNRDAVEGALEFSVYALALGMAVQAHDPDYFQTYPQFSELLAYELEAAMTVFRSGAVMPPFARPSQNATLDLLRTSPDAAALRAFATRLFGAAWVDKTLFSPLPAAPTTPPSAAPVAVDADHDGVSDDVDQCAATPGGAAVWTYGDWTGCAAGQNRDI